MFWVMFDTSTRLDYYRDVHNLLALPNGSTIRYDYRENHVAPSALENARSGRKGKVLLAYAQDPAFQKGDDDPVGSFPCDGTLWVATRFANLAHIRVVGNRLYFDLEMSGYPSNNMDALDRILRPLARAGEVPFNIWITTSDRDEDFELIREGEPSANWTAIVDRIGVPPSQFAGDSFWRIANIAMGTDRTAIAPRLTDHVEIQEGQPVTTRIDAIYPVFELQKLGIEIESRMPEAAAEPAGAEPGVRRHISFATPAGGPLRGLDNRSLLLRRYALGWMETEVRGSNRVDAQDCEVTLTTNPIGIDAYPIGAELKILFEVTKRPGQAFFAILLGIAAALSTGTAVWLGDTAWVIVPTGLAALLAFLAFYVWTGRIKLPGIS